VPLTPWCIACIRPRTYNPYGVYALRFFVNAEWMEVVIDDRIPVGKDGLPVFSRTIDPANARAVKSEIWVMLLEKVSG